MDTNSTPKDERW